jgi:hypothetical protein
LLMELGGQVRELQAHAPLPAAPPSPQQRST